MADRERPDTSTEKGRRSFIHVLNARLPRKRAIAQGLLRSEAGEILLCELTYKSEWDLPGGVVDPKESPAACVVREISEELAAVVDVRGLAAVNWLPPWRGWDDAVLFLFDLGVVPASFTDDLTLSRRELKGVHWVAPADIASHVAPYTARMLEQVLAELGESDADGARTAYLENSENPWGTT
ncbi:ADP-ribose pyrophosphatase YjhB (NUDIX family) [Knoellia remsis]|uniref:ADP-ribose pyrophosphatase YjhB (NUDIX family) n=1 Tax=Knoellia remsis TaxID=407159 RepID=A0A2T0UQU9_9MICO|nr:NUDIX hydrolase [Knoellia remsis]PRY60283.1 ADP-ribose pyrophosphatase YjhB (NUDIX family) [Knoellia remsis]